MDFCNGFNDWFVCTKCPDICTQRCPIESKNAFESLVQKMISHNRNFNSNNNERNDHESFKQP